MMTIKEFQDAHRPWVEHNFGKRPPHWPLLGIGEELGELSHAVLKMEQGIRGTKAEHEANQKDAIADVVIFASDYCSSMGWSMADVLRAESFKSLQESLHPNLDSLHVCVLMARKFAGRLDGAFLDDDVYLGKEAFAGVIVSLAVFCSIQGWSLQELVEKTWEKVSKRDWKKNAKTGGEEAPPSFTFTPDKEGIHLVKFEPESKKWSTKHFATAEEYIADLGDLGKRVMGIDFGAGESKSATVLAERQPGGNFKIVGETEPDDREVRPVAGGENDAGP